MPSLAAKKKKEKQTPNPALSRWRHCCKVMGQGALPRWYSHESQSRDCTPGLFSTPEQVLPARASRLQAVNSRLYVYIPLYQSMGVSTAPQPQRGLVLSIFFLFNLRPSSHGSQRDLSKVMPDRVSSLLIILPILPSFSLPTA